MIPLSRVCLLCVINTSNGCWQTLFTPSLAPHPSNTLVPADPNFPLCKPPLPNSPIHHGCAGAENPTRTRPVKPTRRWPAHSDQPRFDTAVPSIPSLPAGGSGCRPSCLERWLVNCYDVVHRARLAAFDGEFLTRRLATTVSFLTSGPSTIFFDIDTVRSVT